MTTTPVEKEGSGTTPASPQTGETIVSETPTATANPSRRPVDVCPECGSIMVPEGRCFVCRCGYSRCG